MVSTTLVSVLGALSAIDAAAAASPKLLTNINQIEHYWGEITPYHDNAENHFGVKDIGLPDGCQIEQVHVLQRHAQRFPTGGTSDGANNDRFAAKVQKFVKNNPKAKFTGPLTFLNTYRYIMSESYLTNVGARTEFYLGTDFWNKYGRTLYNAQLGQVAYNMSGPAEKQRPKPVIRSTNQSRIENSALNWILGFFGVSFQYTPDPTLSSFNDPFKLVLIAEGGTENDTLASYDSCFNDNIPSIGYIGDDTILTYIPRYLKPATARMQQHAAKGFTFSLNDTYAMQSICAYETAYIGASEFCTFFTREEWEGFEYTTDLQYYYDYSYGQPTGRAQGLGYAQELLARLTKQYIPHSNSSVNSTLDNNGNTFPLNEPFYADFSHDDIIVSVLTALSVDYFYSKLPVAQYPPPANRTFKLTNMTPFGGHLTTEVIGCAAANPAPEPTARVQYYPSQYGYNAAKATHKFIRLRLNNGILPVSSIRGGACGTRPDGLCTMDGFLTSQKNLDKLANYQYACFGNYSIAKNKPGTDYDGTIFKGGKPGYN